MKITKLLIPLIGVILVFLSSCATRYEVAKDSVDPGTAITWKGTKLKLTTNEALMVGRELPPLPFRTARLEEYVLKADGKVTNPK